MWQTSCELLKPLKDCIDLKGTIQQVTSYLAHCEGQVESAFFFFPKYALKSEFYAKGKIPRHTN